VCTTEQGWGCQEGWEEVALHCQLSGGVCGGRRSGGWHAGCLLLLEKAAMPLNSAFLQFTRMIFAVW
jgi:uncharacterized protein YgfB (UPF0149 family)